DGANRFARRVLAMLARHWLVYNLRILRPFTAVLVVRSAAGVKAINPEPGHNSALRPLQLADDRDVVLGLTGDHTGTTPGTHVQIDTHSPLLRCLQRRMGVDARWRMRQLFLSRNFFRELIVFAVALQSRLAYKATAFDAELLLGN